MDCRKDVDMQHVLVLAEEQKIRLYITIHTSKFPLIFTCPLQPKYSYIMITCTYKVYTSLTKFIFNFM
jgi:hypothetical protein